jgi:protein-L-isoaspartate(D-aspartate) O-methyltransferase
MTIAAERTDFAQARKAMIDSQLRVSGVNEDWILAAMGREPREDHVPAAAREHAYIDRAIPLGQGRALPAPLVHGRMLLEAAPTAQDRVLLVGCGSGYLAALLGGRVGTLDVIDAAQAASQTGGMGQHSLLLIDGAIEHLPAGLAAELAEGGRVVTGLVERGVTRLAIGRKVAGQVSLLAVADIGIPVLAEFAAPTGWSF